MSTIYYKRLTCKDIHQYVLTGDHHKNQTKYKKTVIAEQDEFDEDIYWREDKISQGFREEIETKKH